MVINFIFYAKVDICNHWHLNWLSSQFMNWITQLQKWFQQSRKGYLFILKHSSWNHSMLNKEKKPHETSERKPHENLSESLPFKRCRQISSPLFLMQLTQFFKCGFIFNIHTSSFCNESFFFANEQKKIWSESGLICLNHVSVNSQKILYILYNNIGQYDIMTNKINSTWEC